MKTTPSTLAAKMPKSTLAALRKYKTAATLPPVFVSLFSGSRRDSTATPGDTRDTHTKELMLNKPNVLCGQYFHSVDDAGQIKWQGCVIGSPEPGLYLVELFEWLMGEPNGRRLVFATFRKIFLKVHARLHALAGFVAGFAVVHRRWKIFHLRFFVSAVRGFPFHRFLPLVIQERSRHQRALAGAEIAAGAVFAPDKCGWVIAGEVDMRTWLFYADADDMTNSYEHGAARALRQP